MLLSCDTKSLAIKVGARDSLLSQAQTQEVLELLREQHPKVCFQPTWMSSPGDRDQSLSLQDLEKTDLFTKDLDIALINKEIRISVHSAKDLPEPIDPALQVVALTRALDPRDMLVPSRIYERKKLPKRPVIGTSSKRREDAVKKRYPDAICTDIRGSIPCRLEQLDKGRFDAIVVPECALLRLKLHERPRVVLHGTPAPYQGQLAVLSRKEDTEMELLFTSIDTRL